MNQSKRVKWVLVRFFVMGLLLLATSNFAFAQVTASMNGKVVDASGATIPGAMVSVISLETGATRTVTADDTGNYQALSLPVGRYEVKAEKAGFKTAVQTGITLTVGQQAVVNLSLEVGQVQQQVTVTAEAPLVNTTTASTSGLIGEQEVKDLPLNGRSFDQLITLNAGASNTTNLRGLQVGSGGVGASQGQWFTVSGNRMSENQFLWNGVEYMGPSITHAVPGGVSGQLLGVDAVREFNVESNTYGAQYGKRSGGQISIVTTSGTNQLHGSAFEFLRNSAFDARNFFDPDPSLIGRRIPQFQRNQFGGSLGGPIIKGKTFVFGNYEGFRQRLGVSNTSIVPNTCARAGLTSPAAPQPTPYTLSQCLGPVSPGVPLANSAGATMVDIINAYWPAPNGAEKGSGSGQATASYNPKQSIQEDFGTARVDHNFSQKDTLSGNYLIDDGFSVTPIVNPLFFQAFGIRSQVIGLQETHIFSPNVINTFTVGFSRSAITFTSAPYVPIPSKLYFALGQFPNPGRPNIGGGFTAGGGSNTSHLLNVRNLFTYQDQVQIIKGRHQISVGGLITPLGSNENDSKNTSGAASFANLTAFLQGTTTSFTVTPIIAPKYWRQIAGAWFVQDTIQVRPNLTVSLGVRHEFTNGYNEKYGHAANLAIDPITNIPLTNYRVGNNVYTDNNARLLFGPRVGIAWDPFGKGRTSIRAGYGTHFSTIDTLGHSFMDANPPFSGQASSVGQFLSFTPVDASVPVAPACGVGVPKPCTTFAAQGVQANLKMPTVQEWSLSVEQQLTPNTSLRVGYVGTHGYHGQLEGDPNQIPSQLCTNAAGCLAGGTQVAPVKVGPPAVPAIPPQLVPQGTRYIPAVGTIGTPTTATLPNPFLAVGVMLFDESNSSYNGLNVELQHRFSAGLQFKGAYTWSKSLDTLSGLNSGTDGGAGSIYDIVQPKLSYGPSNYNQTHKFVFNGSYDLPVGRGKHWLNGATGITDKVVSGWKVNTIVTAQSGFPFTVLMGINWIGNGEAASGGNTGSPPSYNTAFTGTLLPHTVDHWFDAHAYTLPNVGGTPTIGTFGNVSRNSIVGPNMRNVDISLFKTTSITERVSLQFRAEVFNVLNRANFGTPTNVAFSGTTGVGAGATPSYNASAGSLTSAATSRQIQFGLKLQF